MEGRVSLAEPQFKKKETEETKEARDCKFVYKCLNVFQNTLHLIRKSADNYNIEIKPVKK